MSTPINVVLNCDKYNSSCEINLYGGTVISWKCCGEELLFLSTKSHLDGKKAIRGGIPLVFPNFGAWEHGPQHGFARIQWWEVEQQPTQLENGDVKVTIALCDNEETRKMWNFSFRLLYTVTLSDRTMKTELTIENTGDTDFDFTCLLHTYLKVIDISKVSISGLENITYIDKTKDAKEFKEERALVTISENVDRVYKNATGSHKITGIVGNHTIQVMKENLLDTVVWNPWSEKAAAMSDFGDEEYPHMVCVEAGHVAQKLNLQEKTSFKCGQTLMLLPKADV